MESTSTIPVTRRLVGLRLHRRSGPGGVPESPGAKRLLDLEEHNRKREAELDAMRAALGEARRQLQALPVAVNARLDEVAAVAVELGLSVARELVGKALDEHFVDPTPTVVRCLRDSVQGTNAPDLVVKMNPADVATVKTRLAQEPDLAQEAAEVALVADPKVPPGGVRAETDAGGLRYDPREVLERICDEIRREAMA